MKVWMNECERYILLNKLIHFVIMRNSSPINGVGFSCILVKYVLHFHFSQRNPASIGLDLGSLDPKPPTLPLSQSATTYSKVIILQKNEWKIELMNKFIHFVIMTNWSPISNDMKLYTINWFFPINNCHVDW